MPTDIILNAIEAQIAHFGNTLGLSQSIEILAKTIKNAGK